MPTPASPDVQRYRGAVIGAGRTARQSHLAALRTVAGVRARVDIVAVVDSAADVPPVDGIPLLTDHEQLARVGPLDFFFFQAEDGIRYYKVTGVQTCALPI